MSDITILVQHIAVLANGLRIFLALYFTVAMFFVTTYFLLDAFDNRALQALGEPQLVARIKGTSPQASIASASPTSPPETAYHIHPNCFNIAVLLNHATPKKPGSRAGKRQWWAAAVFGFRAPFTQVVLMTTGHIRHENRMEALRNLYLLLQAEREHTIEKSS
jgi:hypothetical protein